MAMGELGALQKYWSLTWAELGPSWNECNQALPESIQRSELQE